MEVLDQSCHETQGDSAEMWDLSVAQSPDCPDYKRAHLSSTPDTQQILFCNLASVKTSWLPIRRTAVLCHLSCQATNTTQCSPFQGEVNSYISIVSPKHYLKKTGFKEGTNTGRSSNRMRCETSYQSLSGINQTSGKERIKAQGKDMPLSHTNVCQGYGENSSSAVVHEQDPSGKSFRTSMSSSNHSPELFGEANTLQPTQTNGWPTGFNQMDALSPTRITMSFSSITITARRVPHLDSTKPQALHAKSLINAEQLTTQTDDLASAQEDVNVDLSGCRNATVLKLTGIIRSTQRVTKTQLPDSKHTFSKEENTERPLTSRSQTHQYCVKTTSLEERSKTADTLQPKKSLTVTTPDCFTKESQLDVYKSTLSLRLHGSTQRISSPETQDTCNFGKRVRSNQVDFTDSSPSRTTSTHSLASGLSHREPNHPGNQEGSANAKECTCQRNIRNPQGLIRTSQVDDGMGQGRNGSAASIQGEVSLITEHPRNLPMDPRSFMDQQPGIGNDLTLREALERYCPDFISRSQGRVKELEQRAQERRVKINSGKGQESSEVPKRRNCTRPHPLSDNLFKPKERAISGKEMQLRSRRIYNKLPEVTKKKEEAKKKVVSQTNRLRAELYKKKLLEQVLQRKSD